MSKAAYGLVYLLEFLPYKKYQSSVRFSNGRKSIVTRAEGNTIDYSTNGIALDFNVERSANGAANTYGSTKANLKLYNVSDETARVIQQSGVFKLLLNYGDIANQELHPLFQGKMSKASFGKSGVDRYISLDCAAGTFIDKTKFFKKSYKKGVSLYEILTDLISFIQDSYYNYDSDMSAVQYFELDPKDNKIYKSPQVIAGDAIDVLARLLPNYNVLWDNEGVIVNKKITTEKTNEILTNSREALYTLTRKTGLIDVQYTGEPSYSKEGANYSTVDIETVGMPYIKPNDVFQIPEGRDFNVTGYDFKFDRDIKDRSYYRVSTVKHEGNTFTGEWKTKISGYLIKTKDGGAN